MKFRGPHVFTTYFRLSVICLGVLLSLNAPPAWSQATSSSTVTGQVTDQQNAAVAAAEVKLTDITTNIARTALSNEAGRFVFVDVSAGTYTVTFAKTGFSQYKVDQLAVEIGTTMTVNAALKVGSTSTTIEVVAAAGAELQTTTAAVGTTISSQSLMALPNMGRDVSTLAVLQPGVTLGGYTAGAVFDQNTYTLDGGNNTDDMAGNTIGYINNFTGLGGSQTNAAPSGVMPTPVESIEEMKVTTFNQGADFSSSIGSQVQMVTKRGTNQLHGSGYFYYFATNLGAANSWSKNHTPCTPAVQQCDSSNLGYTPLPSNHRQRFGGTLGGPLTPKILGGKTYVFVNYEGSRFPNVATYERTVPTALMRAGVIQVANGSTPTVVNGITYGSGAYIPYNLNPVPVSVNGVTYQPAMCPGGLCDPRGIGLNPIVNQIWQKQMPLPNDFTGAQGDIYNTAGYLTSIRTPLNTNNYIARIDHDFGDKNRFYASYRYLRLTSLTTNQVDIGGILPGDTFGQATPVAPRPQVPSYWSTGLTTNITPTVTNTFGFSYLRNFWQWASANAAPQLPGLGGALEIGGESSNALIPYNVNTQNIRQRFWDGQDKLVHDDVTMIKNNHLFQFGGQYQRNYNFHDRTDNGQGQDNQVVYQSTSSGINFTNSPWIPTTVPGSQQSTYATLYSEVLGLINQPQVVYTRAGSNLALQPIGSSAYDKSVIPYYNVYFSDTWHMKPTFTLTYGLSWTLEMPPVEEQSKQVALVDQAGNLVVAADYLAQRQKAALAGQVYDPILGFATVNNVGKGLKYPYDPFYGEFSPRVSAAWNPRYNDGLLGKILGNGKTVIRGGYGRIYGRLNGVNQVLVPLLGVGLLQAVSCQGPSRTGQCLGTGNVDPTNVFRIGTDGMSAPLPQASPTLPQPFYPGATINGVLNATAGDATVLDPKYKPQRTDNVSFTIQRELSQKATLEVGYLGRIIRNEFQELNLDAVPYMTTLNGQSFAQAFGAVYTALCGLGGYSTQTGNACLGNPVTAVAAQPFFEAALGGAGSAYCTGYANCTQALVSKQTSLIRNTAVSDLWKAMNNVPSWTLGRTMISGAGASVGVPALQATSINTTTSMGFGNYNALFVTFRTRDMHGVTAVSNFTWGKAMGTAPLAQYNSSNTALDPWNMHAMYGENGFDVKFQYNLAIYYVPPFFKSQHGVLGHVLGGWTFSPLFFAQSGTLNAVGYSEGSCSACQAFGEVTPPASSGTTAEDAVGASHYTGSNSAQYNNAGVNGIGTKNPTGINMFTDPSAIISEFRPCVLGVDTSCGGYGYMRNPRNWNVDVSVVKDISYKERYGAQLFFLITNVLNHMQPSSPSLSLTGPTTFGVISGQSNTPRNMEFGLRLHF